MNFKERRAENVRRRELYVRGLPPNHVDEVVEEIIKEPEEVESEIKEVPLKVVKAIKKKK